MPVTAASISRFDVIAGLDTRVGQELVHAVLRCVGVDVDLSRAQKTECVVALC